MAEMYLNGSGQPTGTSELQEHIDNVRVSHRSQARQEELDLIWGDKE